jgi:hypothetical protein
MAAFLRAQAAELRTCFDPLVSSLLLRGSGSRLRERLEKSITDCLNAAGIYEQMIADSNRAQSNILAIQRDASECTTRTIQEVNANRQRAAEIGNQKWSNVFNCGFSRDLDPHKSDWLLIGRNPQTGPRRRGFAPCAAGGS